MRIGILALALLVFAAAAPDTTWAGEEDEKPPLTFHSDQIIERADGTVMFFYRAKHMPAADLRKHVTEVVRDKKLGMRVLQQNVLVLDGTPEQVEMAVDAMAYLDVAPPQVVVEVKVERVTRTKAEGAADGSAKAGTVSELVSQTEVRITQGREAFVESEKRRSMPVLSETRKSDTIHRTTSMAQGWKVKVFAPHVGPEHVLLEVEPTLNGLHEPTAMRTKLPTPIATSDRVRTTVSAKIGESVVITRVEIEDAFEHDGIAVDRPPAPEGTMPAAARAGSTHTEIVITVTPKRVVAAPPEDKPAPPKKADEDAGK